MSVKGRAGCGAHLRSATWWEAPSCEGCNHYICVTSLFFKVASRGFDVNHCDPLESYRRKSHNFRLGSILALFPDTETPIIKSSTFRPGS